MLRKQPDTIPEQQPGSESAFEIPAEETGPIGGEPSSTSTVQLRREPSSTAEPYTPAKPSLWQRLVYAVRVQHVVSAEPEQVNNDLFKPQDEPATESAAAWAFRKTFGGKSYDRRAPVLTTLSAILGLPYKFKTLFDPIGRARLVFGWDFNLYNLLEQVLFAPRIAKNLAKFLTEYVWNLADLGLSNAAAYLKARAAAVIDAAGMNKASSKDIAKILGWKAAAFVVEGLSYIPWLIARIGQSITSPFASMKDTHEAVATYLQGRLRLNYPRLAKYLVPALAYSAAGLRGLFSLAAYVAIGIFAAPLVLAPLAASGVVGSAIVSGLTTAVSWLGSLPVISAIGSALASAFATVGSAFTLGLASGIAASAAAIAGAVAVATPVLAAAKVFLRRISPFKSTYRHAVQPEVVDVTSELDEQFDLNTKQAAKGQQSGAAVEFDDGEKVVCTSSSNAQAKPAAGGFTVLSDKQILKALRRTRTAQTTPFAPIEGVTVQGNAKSLKSLPETASAESSQPSSIQGQQSMFFKHTSIQRPVDVVQREDLFNLERSSRKPVAPRPRGSSSAL